MTEKEEMKEVADEEKKRLCFSADEQQGLPELGFEGRFGEHCQKR